MKINSYLAATCFVPASFGAAFAADLPSNNPPLAPAPIFTVSPFSWTGFYAGVNAGFIAHQGAFTGVQPTTFWENYSWPSRNSSARGGLFGGQIGYNYQAGAMVLGVEADFGLSTAKRTDTDDVTNYAWRQRTGLNNFGTARLRFGYAFDRALVYATGGLAFGSVTEAIQARNNGGTPYSWSRGSNMKTGFTVGAGLEYALTNNWSIKAEGLYYDLGKINHQSSTTNNSYTYGWGARSRSSGVVGRLGLNYRFGGTAAPVVAKY